MEQENYRLEVLNNFFNTEGHLKTIPSQLKKRLIIFEHLVSKLNRKEIYTEKALNEYIMKSHSDFCTIRREFIVNGFMSRNNGLYKVNPKDTWKRWEDL
ncbi:DUF2087 domain-containing protein [Neobacillus niacini]|uniref:DUF2087 domain-containing protein n=1 Tax=Neobacillus niacini TaxID=86668 RepID=UPI0039838F28